LVTFLASELGGAGNKTSVMRMKFRADENIALRRRGKNSLLILSSPRNLTGATFGSLFSTEAMPNVFFRFIAFAD
jgi:hypothetical protein